MPEVVHAETNISVGIDPTGLADVVADDHVHVSFGGELEAENAPGHDWMDGSDLLNKGQTDTGHIGESAVHADDDVVRIGRAGDVAHNDVFDHTIPQKELLAQQGTPC